MRVHIVRGVCCCAYATTIANSYTATRNSLGVKVRTMRRIRSFSSMQEEDMCTIRVPCSMIRRAEASIGNETEKVEAYLTDALGLGLGVLERADARDAEALRVAREFEALTSRLENWENLLKADIEAKTKEAMTSQRQILETYFGTSGALEKQTKELKNELSDESRATSVPASTARAVTKSLDQTISQLRAAIDASDSSSELGKFVMNSRREAAEFRMDIDKSQRALASELKADVEHVVKAANVVLEGPLSASKRNDAQLRGKAYEAAVFDALAALAAPFDDALFDTADETALGSKSKVGDVLVDFRAPLYSVDEQLDLSNDHIHKRPPRMAIEVKSGAFTQTGAFSLEKQIRAAMTRRESDVGLGVVRAHQLPKRLGWLTNLRDDLIIVAYEPNIEHGNVALYCAYKTLRAKAIADHVARRAAAFSQQQHQNTDKQFAQRRADSIARIAKECANEIKRRSADVLTALERLTRMKINTTDLIKMLKTLREDLDELELEVKQAVRYLDENFEPLHDLNFHIENKQDDLRLIPEDDA